ncbi:hypothetical protein CYLTODRAFT_424111 [Cylindrobasidium torrendii FP15055 ss-10]|uniref:Uncharacterized protein n=1 Tax=Cylindrobasidium torrendii FP15055 ss-10 TaxID=1314674 RepID=A0A0D7B678_9AGAR|nr:hypothetical protein CYLTODRAFT_424111 [Cylindrobasidium torrendii FP15055 ss-10]
MIFASFVTLAIAATAAAHPRKRAASCTVPTATDEVTLDAPQTIAAGESFDVRTFSMHPC